MSADILRRLKARSQDDGWAHNSELMAEAEDRIHDLQKSLLDILNVDWERGTNWDTNTIMRSYLEAATAMQAIARAALAPGPPHPTHGEPNDAQ